MIFARAMSSSATLNRKNKVITFKQLTLCFLTSLAALVFAMPSQAAKQEPIHNEYYTIDEKSARGKSAFHSEDFSPLAHAQNFVQTARRVVINLLKWNLHQKTRPLPEEAYIRKLHFGRWINDPTDDTCMNTRAVVLVRNSQSDVTYRHNRECVVDKGWWTDPYSNADLSEARLVQVDHMVPLKNAYVSGAWAWDYKTRCLYANYIGYYNHLVPSTIRENTSKGDRGPEKYLPPDTSYRCQYVKDWLAIKLIWRLTLTTAEVQAIHEVITENHCDMSEFKVTDAELKDQRAYINENIDLCMNKQ